MSKWKKTKIYKMKKVNRAKEETTNASGTWTVEYVYHPEWEPKRWEVSIELLPIVEDKLK